MHNIHTILLIGGRSLRFNESNETIHQKAKSLSLVDKEALISYVLKSFIKHNFKNFILPLGHYKNDFIKYFKKIKIINGIKCKVVINSQEYLTNCNSNHDQINIFLFDAGLRANKAERILKVIKKLSINNFIVSYGDAVGNINLKKVLKLHIRSRCYATGVGMIMRSQYGHYTINKNKLVIEINEKPIIKDLVNIGYFFFKKESIQYFYKYKKLDLENGIIKKLIKKEKVQIYEHKKFWKSVDTLKDLIELRKFLKKN